MRGPVGDEDVEELEVSPRTPEEHRRAAGTLVAWAEQPQPGDRVPPARLLNAAAWHLEAAGDDAASLALLRRSVGAVGRVLPDARCYLHGALLKAGLDEEARQLADELRRSAPEDPDVYVFMGENLELAGDLRQAHRWLTMGARRLEVDAGSGPDEEDLGAFLLLRSRRRVRQQLDLPPDDLDELVPPVDPSAWGGEG